MISNPAFIGTLSLSLISTFVHASPLHPRHEKRQTAVPGVSSPQVVAGYTAKGCYTEATRGRALSGNAYFDSQMTVEKCAAACSKFTLFGVEYGRECFCGNSLNEGSIPAPEGQCSFNCPGNPDQKCGAGNRLNVYEKLVTEPVVTEPTAVPTPTPSTYKAEGCYTEATKGRALTGKTYYDDAMTTAKCASACAGFDLFGLEYYRECYCGNKLQSGSVAAPSNECKAPCTGDKSEICGGDNRLNLYTFGTGIDVTPPVSTPKGYAFDGCFTEATRGRALTGSVYYDNQMTVDKCSTVCKDFTLFGVEYGRECYCGDSLQAGSEKVEETQCNFPCPGNDAEFCGAGNRLDVYHYGAATSTSSSSSSSVTLTSTSSSIVSSLSATTTFESSTSVESPTTTEMSTTISETSTSSVENPIETSTALPTETPLETESEIVETPTSTALPTETPLETESEIVETPTSTALPTETPLETESEIFATPTSTALPTETPLETESEIFGTLTTTATTDLPVETTTTDLPVETTTELPVETAIELPVETTTDLPVETTTIELPVETTTDLPVETTTDLPVETTTIDLPVETTTELPIQTTTELPIETTTDLPVETTIELPIQTTTELPNETSTDLPTGTTTELPTIIETSISIGLPLTTIETSISIGLPTIGLPTSVETPTIVETPTNPDHLIRIINIDDFVDIIYRDPNHLIRPINIDDFINIFCGHHVEHYGFFHIYLSSTVNIFCGYHVKYYGDFHTVYLTLNLFHSFPNINCLYDFIILFHCLLNLDCVDDVFVFFHNNPNIEHQVKYYISHNVLYGRSSTAASLNQVINNLVRGRTYTLQYFYNVQAASATTPCLFTASLRGQAIDSFQSPAQASNVYVRRSATYANTATTPADLSFTLTCPSFSGQNRVTFSLDAITLTYDRSGCSGSG
ncbi:MAG: hypothetical protein Q9221_009086 [Calogaya cf. arnoldii]